MIKGQEYTVGYIDTVYGTKQIDKFVPPQGFHVDNEDEKMRCGLKFDTAFNLLDHMILPWSPVYFSSEIGKPIIGGHFTDAMQIRLRGQIRLLDALKGTPRRP